MASEEVCSLAMASVSMRPRTTVTFRTQESRQQLQTSSNKRRATKFKQLQTK